MTDPPIVDVEALAEEMAKAPASTQVNFLLRSATWHVAQLSLLAGMLDVEDTPDTPSDVLMTEIANRIIEMKAERNENAAWRRRCEEAERDRDRWREIVEAKNCPAGCTDHEHHYYQIEVLVGPLPEPVDRVFGTELDVFSTEIADLAMPQRPLGCDVSVSGAVRSDVALQLDGEGHD